MPRPPTISLVDMTSFMGSRAAAACTSISTTRCRSDNCRTPTAAYLASALDRDIGSSSDGREPIIERTTVQLLAATAIIRTTAEAVNQKFVGAKLGDGVRLFPIAHRMNASAHVIASLRDVALANNSVRSHSVDTRP